MQRTKTARTVHFKEIKVANALAGNTFFVCKRCKNGRRMEAGTANCKKSGDSIKYKYMTEAELPVGLTAGQSPELYGTIVYLKMTKVTCSRPRA